MSRSRRKRPCYHIGCSKNKRIANRLVRRYKGELGNYCFYKKLYESYNIIDYIYLDYEQLRMNKLFRRIAKIVRDMDKGRIPLNSYSLNELKEILEETKDSFLWTNKK